MKPFLHVPMQMILGQKTLFFLVLRPSLLDYQGAPKKRGSTHTIPPALQPLPRTSHLLS